MQRTPRRSQTIGTAYVDTERFKTVYVVVRVIVQVVWPERSVGG